MTTSLLAAVLALAVLTVLPGPDVAVVMRVALGQGRAAAIRTALGIATGLLVWGLLTAAGLAALLATSATAYTVVKLAGAAYLTWLGLQALWRSRSASPSTGETSTPVLTRTPWRTGFLTNMLNPKIAVFYTGLLPQLVPDGAPHALTLMGLVFVHALLSIAWLAVIATAVARASVVLQRPRIRTALEVLTGVLLIGFGLRLAFTSAQE